MTSFLNHQRGAGQLGNEVNDNHRRGRGFWLPWIRQTQENNRTPFHNNTCQIRTGLAHTTTREECQTTCSWTIRLRSSNSVVDKRTKNN